MSFMLFFRLAFQLFGVKISSFYLERPLNAKTFRDGGQKPFSTLHKKVENGFIIDKRIAMQQHAKRGSTTVTKSLGIQRLFKIET